MADVGRQERQAAVRRHFAARARPARRRRRAHPTNGIGSAADACRKGRDSRHAQWPRLERACRRRRVAAQPRAVVPRVSLREEVPRLLLGCHRFLMGVDMERSQYGLSLVICAVLAAVANGDEPGETTAMNLRQNTVRIETRIGSETENGFGFIVGEDDEGTLYAVTANHVVSSDDVDAEEPVVKVELFSRQGRKLID